MLGEAAGLGDASVVDQDADAGIVAQSGFNGSQVAALGEVGRKNVDGNAGVVALALGQCVQPPLVARDQYQIVAAASKTFGLNGTDAAGGAGDEDSRQAHDVSLEM